VLLEQEVEIEEQTQEIKEEKTEEPEEVAPPEEVVVEDVKNDDVEVRVFSFCPNGWKALMPNLVDKHRRDGW
jgi:hypothetical protein